MIVFDKEYPGGNGVSVDRPDDGAMSSVTFDVRTGVPNGVTHTRINVGADDVIEMAKTILLSYGITTVE